MLKIYPEYEKPDAPKPSLGQITARYTSLMLVCYAIVALGVALYYG